MKKCKLISKSVLVLMLAGWIHFPTQAQVFASSHGNLTDPASHTAQQHRLLKQILNELEKKHKIRFTYDSKTVEDKLVQTSSQQFADFEEELAALLKPLKLTFKKIEKNNYVIVSDSPQSDSAATQTPATASIARQSLIETINPVAITITGKVVDDQGQSAPGVSIVLKGTTTGTSTDGDGNYSLTVPDGNGTLVVSYIGYTTEEIAINNRTTINVTLVPDIKALEEVVVVGYGSQLKKEVTGAVQTVSAAELKDIPVSTVAQKLQGRLAGVQINQTTGKPGQGMNVRIRGQLSVTGGSDPLYVVDGFPITGNLNAINPDEIEDITVLKDAASTSLYGSRAANGVVLITTKKGKAGQTNVSFNTFAGIQKVPMRGRIDMLNAEEFAQFKKEYYEDQNAASPNPVADPVPDVFKDPSQYRGKNNDWYDALLREAPVQSYNLTITSNKERLNTALVVGVFNQQGVVLNNEYKRYSGRLNMDYQVSDKVRVGLNIAPNYVFDNTPRTDGDRGTGILFNALHTWPIMPIYDENGDLTLVNRLLANTGNIFAYPNWVRAANELTNETRQINLLANAYIQYSPVKGLTLKSTVNAQTLNQKFFFFNPSTATSAINTPIPTTAVSIRENREEVTLLNENLATFTKSFGSHNFELLGGFSNQWFRRDNTRIQADTYADDRLPTVQGGININRAGTNSDVQEWSLTSLFSRLTYNFKGKYLFTAAVRGDGSSRFGNNNRWGVFPSASVGWVVSDEPFLQGISQLSFAKLRASFGVTGNNNIGNYTQYARINNTINAVFGNNVAPGAGIISLANPNLGWETTSQFDAGIDLGIFNDRIQFMYDFYTKKTTNLLYSVQIPQESGFTNFNDNIGEINFWGHEIALNTRNLEGKLKWTTNANISINRNKVVALAEGIDRVYGTFHITQVG